MKKFIITFTFLPLLFFSQNPVKKIINDEFEKGHFNGSVLYFDGRKIVQINEGLANIQFAVPITNETRFPIASVTKLFTTIAILQLYEKKLLNFDDKVGQFIPYLSDDCKNITVRDLLLHHSGLENEPIKAVQTKYKIDEYIQNFVKKSSKPKDFNYNNVDFVILSKIIEKITKKSFSQFIAEAIFNPLKMNNSGFVEEEKVIKNLAYGYHNYSFGDGKKDEPLFNDRRFISNYYGAGAIYSTTEDLYKLLISLKNNTLISKKTKEQFVLNPQSVHYEDWLSGKPTFGFYADKEDYLRRSGNIDGYNSEIIINKDFSKILIILCNADTADLQKLSDKIYEKLN